MGVFSEPVVLLKLICQPIFAPYFLSHFPTFSPLPIPTSPSHLPQTLMRNIGSTLKQRASFLSSSTTPKEKCRTVDSGVRLGWGWRLKLGSVGFGSRSRPTGGVRWLGEALDGGRGGWWEGCERGGRVVWEVCVEL